MAKSQIAARQRNPPETAEKCKLRQKMLGGTQNFHRVSCEALEQPARGRSRARGGQWRWALGLLLACLPAEGEALAPAGGVCAHGESVEATGIRGWRRDLAREGVEPNPGPDLKVWVANGTSLNTAWGALAGGDWDALLLQEPRMAGHEPVLKQLRDDGCQWLPGPLDSSGRCLVATVIRRGEAASDAAEDEPRAQTVTWQAADAPPVLFTNTYGDAAGTAAARAHTAAIIGNALPRHVQHGRGVSLLVGDLNAEMHELACTYALEMAGWVDVGDGIPTALPPNSDHLRRIDHVIANPVARAVMREYQVDWSHGLPVHAVQKFTLRFEHNLYERKWHPPPALPAALPSALSRDDAWQKAVAAHGKAFEAAEKRRCPDRSWKALQDMLLLYAGERAGLGEAASRKPGQAAWTPLQRRSAPDGTNPNMPYYKAAKRERRIRAALAHWTDHGFKGRGRDAWDAFREAELVSGDTQEHPDDPPRAYLEELLREAVRQVEATTREINDRRKEGWHKWVDQSLNMGSGPLYKWIRTGPKQPPEPFVPGEGERRGPQAKVDRIDEYWWGLWGANLRQRYDVQRWVKHLRDLPPMAPPGDFTVQQLLRVLKKWGRRKASGTDGWRPVELKDLPQQALEWVVRFFKVVERAGRWPKSLRHAGVAMLEKKGTPEPDDRRPIVLLPIFYRWWAAVRAQQLQSWMRQHKLLEAGPMASAESLANDLAFIMQRARAFGAHFDGVALDWSKCYDRMPLPLVEEALRAAGVPSELVRPLVDMYKAPRRVLADGRAGEERVPTHCIPAGCPMATMVLALFTYAWRCELHACVRGAQSRAYVDDLTAIRERRPGDAGGAAAARVANAMQEVADAFARDFSLALNQLKSVRYSSDAETRQALQLTEGVTVSPHFVDLGADQSATAKASYAKRTERGENMLVRAARVGMLPVPYGVRATMTAASAVAAGTYGAAAGPIPVGDLKQMRRAAFEAVWRARFRVPLEIAFANFISWRADPQAVAVVKPWLYLRDACKRGLTSPLELEELWDACGDTFVGPVAACRQAMRLAGLHGGPAELSHPDGPRVQPLRATARQLQDFLLAAMYATEVKWVVQRRPDLAVWEQGVDRWGSFRSLSKGRDPSDDGLLRNIMAGGSVTQVVAQKWRGGGDTCPHCQVDSEDAAHKFWVCPAWQQARDEAVPAVRRHEICARASGPVLELGLLPAAPAPVGPHSWPVPRSVGVMLYSDGSAVHPTDYVLRRAAWAVVWRGPRGWVRQSGTVPGRQTVGRAELCAAIWAYQSRQRPTMLCIDNRYVADGVAAVMRGDTLKYLEGKDADLWQMLVEARPLTEPTWVPAHRTKEDYLRKGYSAEQWEGNRQADLAAKAATMCIRPEPQAARHRAMELRDLGDAQQVLIAVHRAVLAKRDGDRAGIVRQAKRKRFVRMALFAKARAPRRLRIRRWKPPARDILDEDAPGVHHLVAAPGAPVGRTTGNFKWQASCTKCGASKGWTQQWPALARTVCRSEASAVADFRVEMHDIQREGRAFRCGRCFLAVPAVQRARMARTRCSVPVPLDIEGNVVPSAQGALRHAATLSARWRADVFGTTRLVGRRGANAPPGPAPAPVPAAPPGPAVLRWRAHLTVAGGGARWCLLCSRRARGMGASLADSPCPGPAAPSAALVGALKGRLLDVGLATAVPAAVSRAQALGWVAVPLPGLQASSACPVPQQAHSRAADRSRSPRRDDAWRPREGAADGAPGPVPDEAAGPSAVRPGGSTAHRGQARLRGPLDRWVRRVG